MNAYNPTQGLLLGCILIIGSLLGHLYLPNPYATPTDPRLEHIEPADTNGPAPSYVATTDFPPEGAETVVPNTAETLVIYEYVREWETNKSSPSVVR